MWPVASCLRGIGGENICSPDMPHPPVYRCTYTERMACLHAASWQYHAKAGAHAGRAGRRFHVQRAFGAAARPSSALIETLYQCTIRKHAVHLPRDPSKLCNLQLLSQAKVFKQRFNFLHLVTDISCSQAASALLSTCKSIQRSIVGVVPVQSALVGLS